MTVARQRAFCGFLPATLILCGLAYAEQPGATIGCHVEAAGPLSRFTPTQRTLLGKLNHVDSAHLARLRRILVPNRWNRDELLYSPMPSEVPELAREAKALVVDIPTQVFGAYEEGKLVRWGPVSTGDRNHQTPSGTYHLNWHARVHVSSENSTWVMPWYFNFDSVQGLALHEYTLPGRPASHGCARMLEVDAKWLFDWGNGWTIDPETRQLVQRGTLVLVLGSYNYRAPQPWLRPEWWSRGVTLPVDEIVSDQ